MSERITSQRVFLVPSEGRPMDDVEYPGFLHPTRLTPDVVRIEIIGTSHRLDSSPEAPAREIGGDRPYLEIDLSTGAARRLARALLDEVDGAGLPESIDFEDAE